MPVNPIIPGTVTARKFATFAGAVAMNAVRVLSGTTKVNVFGTTNGMSGTAYAFKVYSGSNDAGDVTLESGGVVVATVARGTDGAAKCADLNSLAFTAGGTMAVKSTLASDHSVVELVFK